MTSRTTTVTSGWSRTGSSRPCNFGASGAARAADTATLSTGDYELEWSGERIAFTVPEGASVTLSWRELSNGSSVAVFSLSDGSELVVAADSLSGVSGAVAPDDPTLAAIAASLRDPTAAAADTTVTTTTECAVAEQAADGVTRVNLDAGGCAIIRAGGSVSVTIGDVSRSFALPADEEWLAIDATAHNAGGTAAVTLLRIETGAYLTLSLADGVELSRHVPEGDTNASALFDALVSAEPASSSE